MENNEQNQVLLPEKYGYDLMSANTFEQQIEVAKVIAQSGMVPERYKDKYQAVMVALQFGREVGLPGLQALQSIYIVNGQPALYGDGSLAVCMRHPAWQGKKEPKLSQIMADKIATVTVYRKGCVEVTQDFSLQNAIDAGLYYEDGGASLGKDKWKYEKSAWAKWWPRMLLWRARGFALRDQYADALKGIACAEEIEDYLTTKGEPVIVSIKDPKPAGQGWISRMINKISGPVTIDMTEDEAKEASFNPVKTHIDNVVQSDIGKEGKRASEDLAKMAMQNHADSLSGEKSGSPYPKVITWPDVDDEPEMSPYDKEAAELGFISDAQVKEFTGYCAENNLPIIQVNTWLQKNSVNSIREIPLDRYDTLFASFKFVTKGEKKS